MSYSFRESWADFFGNVIIDSVYSQIGIDLWPEPYNYLEFAGIEYFKKRIMMKDEKMEKFNRSGLFWYELNSKMSFNNFQDLFTLISKQNVKNPNARKEFLDVLQEACSNDDIENWYNLYADYLIVNNE